MLELLSLIPVDERHGKKVIRKKLSGHRRAHPPEFENEKIRKNIEAKAKEFELHHPIMIDNDSSYWRAMNNRYWPAFYILDKQGKIRAVFFGETHEGDRRAKQIESTIKTLLAELE